MKNEATNWRSVVLAPLVFLIALEANATDSATKKVYEQCISHPVTGVEGKHVANEAQGLCRDLVTNGRPNDEELPSGALDKLIVHAGFGWGIFSGTLYNGNGDYTVTRVTVLLTPIGNRKSAGELMSGNEYDIELNVQPLSKSALSMPIPSDNTLEYSWKIAKVYGYKTR